MTDAPAPWVELRGVSKSFGGLRAIKSIDLKIEPGQIVGLVGENGAGKSTLIKLLSGVERPDEGTIQIGGKAARFGSPREAIDAGIATVHQELEYFEHLSVAENMLMGEPWPRRGWGAVDWRALHAAAARRLSVFGISLPTDAPFSRLTAAEKQEVGIANALARRARLLILDEPTASLSEPEVNRLSAHLRRIRDAGVTILYVSHRLDEIFALCDPIVVLRDGRLVAVHGRDAVEASDVVRDMIGRPMDQVYPRTRTGRVNNVVFETVRASREGMFDDVSLSVHAGEIVGLAGLVGSGRSELGRAIYGLYSIERGTMRLGGKPWRPRHPRDSLKSGLAYIPEERKRQGLVMAHSVRESISVGFSDQIARLGIVPFVAERARVARVMDRFEVRAGSSTQAVGTLSGGNQQKALLARWLERDPTMLILDEPTRGVDVGAKAQIHAIVDQLAASGKGVLFISSDLAEIVGMSDRVLVMNRGTIGTELQGSQVSIANVILAASGLYQAAAPSNPADGVP